MVDRDGLENRCGCKLTVGSNPTLSATRPSGEVQIKPTSLIIAGLLAPSVSKAVPPNIPPSNCKRGILGVGVSASNQSDRLSALHEYPPARSAAQDQAPLGYGLPVQRRPERQPGEGHAEATQRLTPGRRGRARPCRCRLGASSLNRASLQLCQYSCPVLRNGPQDQWCLPNAPISALPGSAFPAQSRS